jgi:uncharacterized membrane protein YhaH (DUF805 family)
MSVLGEFLGFEGRVTRLGYLWRLLAMGAALAALAALATWALATLIHPDGLVGAITGMRGVVTGALLLALWSSFALGTRRLRDIGLEPTHIVPFYAALWVCNAVLLEPMSHADPSRFGPVETAWRAIQVVILLPLLFWPPRAKPPRAPSVYDEHPQPTAYLDWRAGG